MVDSPKIQDPEVAIQLARIDGKMESMKISNDMQSKQLDSIVSDLRELTRISLRFEIQHQRFDLLETSHTTTKEKINKMFYFSSGVTSIAVILLSLILWVVGLGKDRIILNSQRLDAIELHLATDQVRPYRHYKPHKLESPR